VGLWISSDGEKFNEEAQQTKADSHQHGNELGGIESRQPGNCGGRGIGVGGAEKKRLGTKDVPTGFIKGQPGEKDQEHREDPAQRFRKLETGFEDVPTDAIDPMKKAPEKEAPGRPVPEPGYHEDNQEVDGPAFRLAPSQRDINVIPKPVAEADMPPSPKIANIGR